MAGKPDHHRSDRALRWLAIAGTLAAMGLLAACGDYPGSTIDPRTDVGESVQALYVSVFWWTMFVLVVVWSVLGYVILNFREKPGQPKPRQIHGHLGLEIAWTIGPAMIVVAIAIPTVQGVFATQAFPAGDPLIIEVTGHRYWWEFEYPAEGVVTANEVHVPTGRPIAFRLGSDDVIHSFWVPMLGGKRDVNPPRAVTDGREPEYNWYYVTVNEAGAYGGQCAEFCGQSHALMGIRVVAESPAEFAAWVGRMNEVSPTALPPDPTPPAQGVAPDPEQDPPADTLGAPVTAAQEDPLVAEGREIFLFGSSCVACHAIEGTPAAGELGPSLTRVGARSHIAAGMLPNTPENLFRWIRDPGSIKPDARMPSTGEAASMPTGQGTWPATGLTDDQVRAVAAYLSSLR